MSLRAYLFLIYIAVFIGLLGTILFVLKQIQKIENSYRLELEASKNLEILKNISSEFRDLRHSIRIFAVIGEEVEIERLNLSMNRMNNYVKQLPQTNSQIKIIFDELIQITSKIGKLSKESIHSIYINEFLPLEDKLIKILDTELQTLENTLHTTRLQMQKTRKEAHSLTIMFFMIIALILLTGMVVFYRVISKPLFNLISAIREFGKGKSSILEAKGPSEIRLLINTFNNMESEIKELEKQVVQLERLSVVGQLAGGVAHEINNPLVSVLGYTQMLLEKLPDGDARKEQLKKIEHSARRCANIVKALLDFSKSTEYRFEFENIVKIIEDTLDFVETEIKKYGIHVEKIYEFKDKVFVSISHIQQAFLNIISNSINAMKGSEIKKILVKTYLK
ncbi:MAG: HAMP domain-containing histidine kinase, partial [bacterium]|nr:HAMP domain-containing histidine kinase [bacterium]